MIFVSSSITSRTCLSSTTNVRRLSEHTDTHGCCWTKSRRWHTPIKALIPRMTSSLVISRKQSFDSCTVGLVIHQRPSVVNGLDVIGCGWMWMDMGGYPFYLSIWGWITQLQTSPRWKPINALHMLQFSVQCDRRDIEYIVFNWWVFV